MKYKRTPDARFENLKDYSFEPNYLSVDDTEGGELRLHYLDEGPADGPVVLLMHGQPAWSYLYRHMIPLLLAEGFRVVVPDLIGFGRSDKPTRIEDYTYARHVTWMTEWLTRLDLNNITVFFQDWGSMIGLRLVAAFPERFSHVVLANGALVAGPIPVEHADLVKAAYETLPVVSAAELEPFFLNQEGVPGILYWRKHCAKYADFSVGAVMSSLSSGEKLTQREIDAFNAPYPDESYLAGARRFPSLIPLFADDSEVAENRAAWEVLAQFDKPFMCAFADNDPVTAGGDKPFLERVAGCRGVNHRTISPAAHFLQQDQPEQCVQAILDVRSGA